MRVLVRCCWKLVTSWRQGSSWISRGQKNNLRLFLDFLEAFPSSPWFLCGSLTFARPGFLGSTDLPSPHEVQIYQTLRKMKLSDEFFMKVLTASKNIVLQKSYNWLNIFSALKNWKCVFTKSVRYPYYLDSILCFPSCKYAFSVFQCGKNIHSVVTFL